MKKEVVKKLRKQMTKNGSIEQVFYNNEPVYSDYWIRKPVIFKPIEVNINSIFSENDIKYEQLLSINDKEWLKFQIFNRTTPIDKEENCFTFTFIIINNLKASNMDIRNSADILFQNEMYIETKNSDLIIPYKEKKSLNDTDEEKEFNLLYRNKRIFAIGHGASVVWNSFYDKKVEKVNSISTSFIPEYELPQIAPTHYVELSMLDMSDIGNWENGKSSLKELVNEYEKWVVNIDEEVNQSDVFRNEYKEPAKKILEKCRLSLNRMKNGLDLILNSPDDSSLIRSFKWMNRAMLWQQQRSKVKQRKWIRTGQGKAISYKLEKINRNQNNPNFVSLKEYHNESEKMAGGVLFR
jgi:hypothetical protein